MRAFMFYAITNLRAYKLTHFFKISYFEFCVTVKKAFVQTTIRLVYQPLITDIPNLRKVG